MAESYPAEILQIKARFLRKQYRQCIDACRDFLQRTQPNNETKTTLQLTFALFYLALSHDEIARAIHNYNQSKVPAFVEAQLLYQDALQSLETLKKYVNIGTKMLCDNRDDPFIEHELNLHHLISTPNQRKENNHPVYPQSSPRMTPSSPSESTTIDSSPSPSKGAKSNMYDPAVKERIKDIVVTSQKRPRLQRDYSSMSLPDAQPQHMSQGLMRPIRRGEAPKQYHLPPRMPYSGSSLTRSGSNMQKTFTAGSPIRKPMLTPTKTPSPAGRDLLPVSPLGSDSVLSGLSPTSPLSNGRSMTVDEICRLYPSRDVRKREKRLEEHLEAMEIQIETHIRLLEDARQQTTTIQSKRSEVSSAWHEDGLSTVVNSARDDTILAQSHSFCKFSAKDTKAAEIQARVEAGRDRAWNRVRFDPSRYRRLADLALAEL